jgi:lactate dehydrogenase-like 2-hydroxyacid dehydrogenase
MDVLYFSCRRPLFRLRLLCLATPLTVRLRFTRPGEDFLSVPVSSSHIFKDLGPTDHLLVASGVVVVVVASIDENDDLMRKKRRHWMNQTAPATEV